jgi:hypothetical protein
LLALSTNNATYSEQYHTFAGFQFDYDESTSFVGLRSALFFLQEWEWLSLNSDSSITAFPTRKFVTGENRSEC